MTEEEKTNVSFYISKKTIEKLDKYAVLLGLPSRSAFLEWLIEYAYGRLEPNIMGLIGAFKDVVTMRKKVMDKEKVEKKEAKLQNK
jgi:Ribbon-helix-helix protein, copG family.